jgi:hypothetical protein
MSATNFDFVQALYAICASGDFDGVLKNCSPGIEWCSGDGEDSRQFAVVDAHRVRPLRVPFSRSVGNVRHSRPRGV